MVEENLPEERANDLNWSLNGSLVDASTRTPGYSAEKLLLLFTLPPLPWKTSQNVLPETNENADNPVVVLANSPDKVIQDVWSLATSPKFLYRICGYFLLLL